MLSLPRMPEQTGLKQDVASWVDIWPIGHHLGASVHTQDHCNQRRPMSTLSHWGRTRPGGVNLKTHSHCRRADVLPRKSVQKSILVEFFLIIHSTNSSQTLCWATEIVLNLTDGLPSPSLLFKHRFENLTDLTTKPMASLCRASSGIE